MIRLVKPVRRQVTLARGEFVVTLEPGWITFRPKGTWRSRQLELPLDSALFHAGERKALERRAVRRKRGVA